MLCFSAALLLVIFCIFNKYIWPPLFYWSTQNIPSRPTLPIVGNFLDFALQKKSFSEIILNEYFVSFKERLWGIFLFSQPMLMIRDPKLIFEIGVKQFSWFTDHISNVIPKSKDVLLARNLFYLKGKEWVNLRATLSLAFAGNKLLDMFPLLSECGEQMQNYCWEIHENAQETIEVDLKHIYTQYAVDMIATAAFGSKLNSFKNPNNAFYKVAVGQREIQLWQRLMINLTPRLWQMLGLKLIPDDTHNYCLQIIKEAIKYRKKNNVTRPDILQLLLESRKGVWHPDQDLNPKFYVGELPDDSFEDSIYLTDLDITAQMFTFFLTGLDSVSTALCFASLELALNPECQKKLQQEIDEKLIECNGKISYVALQQMTYIDMVVSETLRKWPTVSQTYRECIADCKIILDGNKKMKIKKGTNICFPFWGIHRDPKYFPNPSQFDPERFNRINKKLIQPHSYLPFGIGPRICIGLRFATIEMKIALFHMLSKFDFIVSSRTEIPIKMNSTSMILNPEDQFWIALKRRRN